MAAGIWSRMGLAELAVDWSDNPIRVPDVSATDAARNFAGLLDAIEHRGERYTIVRRGRAVAHLEPVPHRHGAEVKAVLRRQPTDAGWTRDMAEIRSRLEVDDR